MDEEDGSWIGSYFDDLFVPAPEQVDDGGSPIPQKIPSIGDLLFNQSTPCEIPNSLTLGFIADLYQPETTDSQWALGWHLLKRFNRLRQARKNTFGRSDETLERVFIGVYKEWCWDKREMGDGEFRERAALLFNVRPSTLRRWSAGASGAREAAAAQFIARHLDRLKQEKRRTIYEFLRKSWQTSGST